VRRGSSHGRESFPLIRAFHDPTAPHEDSQECTQP